jgi:dihydropteroate synthase
MERFSRVGPFTFEWGARTYVMGIVNASPDSFAGEGAPAPEDAAALGRRLAEEGADLLDVGGASTRPGAAPVPEAVELARVLPVVAALAQTGLPVSIDTSSAVVARAALDAGAWLVNDVTGLTGDPAMAPLVAGRGAGVVVMANHRLPLPPGASRGLAQGGDVVALTRERWRASLATAAEAGIPPDRIVLDPGLGFGLAPARSLELLRRLPELRGERSLRPLPLPFPLPFPLLVGPSRKGFVGWALGGLPVEERLEGTLAAVALAIAGGADVVRAHDVRATHRVRLLADAVCRAAGAPPAPADSG